MQVDFDFHETPFIWDITVYDFAEETLLYHQNIDFQKLALAPECLNSIPHQVKIALSPDGSNVLFVFTDSSGYFIDYYLLSLS